MVIKTTDGGNSWFRLTMPLETSYNAFYAENANTIYIAGSNGAFVKTTDAGATWSVIETGVKILSLALIYMAQIQSGLPVLTRSSVLQTAVQHGKTLTTTFPSIT
jgi:photosystem II stability/assembly factor-like uncharacterized protein